MTTCARRRKPGLSDADPETGPEIAYERNGSKARYVIRTEAGEAELTLSILSPTLVIADARDQGFKIVPLCPYVNAKRARHPEWAELFAT